MAATRSSTREMDSDSSPPREDDVTATGEKRKAEVAASPSRDRKTAKKQTTIEEAIGDDNNEDATQENGTNDITNTGGDQKQGDEKSEDVPTKDEATQGASGEDAIEESSQREKKMPSNIIEKGIIYFFTRNRVGIEEAESVGDLQRTYFALRPLPHSAKLGDGPIPESKNNRLFALPKKVFPKSHSDRFMAFVEKGSSTIQDLKDSFLQGEQHETKTAGTRSTEPPRVVAEGVYMITRTEDRTTHLVYALTIPSELNEVQEDLGLRAQGSFIISVKNPNRPGPASARLPQGPNFPKEFIEEFRGLAWAEVKPKYLDYENTQILLIGEYTEKATEPTTKDKKHDKENPKEELEELEHEDELRVEHLKGDDSVFADLKISKEQFPQVPTTW